MEESLSAFLPRVMAPNTMSMEVFDCAFSNVYFFLVTWIGRVEGVWRHDCEWWSLISRGGERRYRDLETGMEMAKTIASSPPIGCESGRGHVASRFWARKRARDWRTLLSFSCSFLILSEKNCRTSSQVLLVFICARISSECLNIVPISVTPPPFSARLNLINDTSIQQRIFRERSSYFLISWQSRFSSEPSLLMCQKSVHCQQHTCNSDFAAAAVWLCRIPFWLEHVTVRSLKARTELTPNFFYSMWSFAQMQVQPQNDVSINR